MHIFKGILQFLIQLFFKVFFFLFGEPKLDLLMQKTLNLYQGSGFTELFSLIRLWDAPFEEINRLVPNKGLIVDLGSGDGILTNYLALAGPKRELLGIEINQTRLEQAEKRVTNTKFIHGDILKKEFPPADTILMTHLLHHLPSLKDQEHLIKKTKQRLKKDGLLLITEIAERPWLKFIFTWLTDVLTVPILFENRLFSSQVHFRKRKDWEKLLKENGFKVKSFSADCGKPFSHIVLVARK